MFENDDNKQDFASPFGNSTESQNTPPPHTEPPYTQQPYYTESPYTQQPYMQQPYSQPAYGQPFGQAPPGSQAYGPSPYAQFAQAQYGQQAPQPKKKKEKKHREGAGRRNTAILVIIMILACAGSGIGGGYIGANMSNRDSESVPPSENNPVYSIEPTDDITTTEAVAKKVLSSVVGITSTGTYVSDYGFFGKSENEISGIGTGMIIDKKGFILTNSHVVLDGSVNSIFVLLSNGEEVEGRVIWNDSGLDLAIVKIEASGLDPVELGDSEEVMIGSYVAAVGNPLGLEFSGSITQGVVSGLNRTITVSDTMGMNISTMQGLIQVDAAINAGNSGGPLLNRKGQVIGVNTAKATAEGMGFAIPINTAIPIVEKVIKDGSFERVFIGVSAADVKLIRENYPNVELKAEKGACITDVNPGSPAEKGGLKVKDVIIAIDDKDISGSDSLIKMLLGYESGDVIKVTFDRDGEIIDTEVTLLSQTELDRVQQEENPFRDVPQGNTGR